MQKALEGHLQPQGDGPVDMEQFRAIMKQLGFVKPMAAAAADEQLESELKSIFNQLAKEKGAQPDSISCQALQQALPIFAGLKPDPANLCLKAGRLVKNRRQLEFERGVRQGLDTANKAYEGSKFKPTSVIGADKEKKAPEHPSHQPSGYKGVGLGVTGAKPP